MIEKDLFKITPFRIAFLGILITTAFLVILVGATIQRKNAATTLKKDITAIEANFSKRKQADLARITELEETLAQAESEVQTLMNYFPESGKAFPLYQQAQEIAIRSQCTLLEISQESMEILGTSQGQVKSTLYQMRLKGDPRNCITFIENIEQTGLQTIDIQNILITPSLERCELDVQVLRLP